MGLSLETITTESITIRPTGLEEITRQQAERIERLEAERAAHETTIAALTEEVEQLQAVIHIRPSKTCSWLGCSPACDTKQ